MIPKAQLKRIKNKVNKARLSDSLVMVFEVLGDRGRFNVFKLLIERDGMLCVSEMASVFGVSVPAASQQLKLLELSGLVIREREGQAICYCLNKENPVVLDLIKLIKKSSTFS